MKLTIAQKSYIAGFLDGDGSIYVQAKPNKTYHYKFQISPSVVFFQSSKNEKFIKEVQKILNIGYIRRRKDGVCELIIGKEQEIIELLNNINKYLILKKPQSILMIKILKAKQNIKNANDFLRVVELIDQFYRLNYSKKRLNNNKIVKDALKIQGLLPRRDCSGKMLDESSVCR